MSKTSQSKSANDGRYCKTLDLGNNEQLVRGVFPRSNGTFDALTYTQSKTGFKTFTGAANWLKRRGIAPNGDTLEG